MRKRRIDVGELRTVSERLGDVVIDPSLWPELMEQFCGAVGAHGAALLQSDARTPDIPRTASADESFRRYFAEGWHARDGRERCVPLVLSGQKVVRDQDICTPEEIERSDFYQDLLASYSFRWFAGIAFSAGPALWLLTFQRSAQEGSFSKAEADILATLSHRMSEVATLSDAVGRRILTGASGALDMIGRAAIALDRQGRVLGANRAAEELFDPELRVVQERLHVGDPSAARALEGLLDQLRTQPDTQPLESPPIMVRGKRGLVMIRALPVDPAARSPFLGARILLFLTDLSRRPVPSTTLLAQAFALTPAEARLASLIGVGHSIDHAADLLGVTRMTAKTQLKAVFAKTGAHRQSELVALLARM